MKHSIIARLLHFLLAAAIVHQLFGSLIAERPRPTGRPGNFAFDLHEVIGPAGTPPSSAL